MEGNLRLKIDWASLMAGNKSTIFALLYYIFEAIFQVQVPRGLENNVVVTKKKRILICFDSASHRVQPTVPASKPILSKRCYMS